MNRCLTCRHWKLDPDAAIAWGRCSMAEKTWSLLKPATHGTRQAADAVGERAGQAFTHAQFGCTQHDLPAPRS